MAMWPQLEKHTLRQFVRPLDASLHKGLLGGKHFELRMGLAECPGDVFVFKIEQAARAINEAPTGFYQRGGACQDGLLLLSQLVSAQMAIAVLSMDGDRKVTPLLDTEDWEGGPAVSPDGRWLAYQSNMSSPILNTWNIFVERFPDLGDRQRVSIDEGRVRLQCELATPLCVGIGIHTGEAIIGRMGPPKMPIVTALGDTVNTASRLEGLAKELSSAPVVASERTIELAGVSAPLKDVQVRGRETALRIAVFGDARALRHALSAAAAAVAVRG
jgi:hypothetical protein